MYHAIWTAGVHPIHPLVWMSRCEIRKNRMIMYPISEGHSLPVDSSAFPERPQIFVVEDNPGVCEAIQLTLTDLGYLVAGCCDSAEEALKKIPVCSVDLVLMDINLSGDMDGVEAATRISRDLFLPVVFLTGNTDDSLNSAITSSGSYGYLVKPFNERELNLTIGLALSNHSKEVQVRQSERFYRTLAEVFEEGLILIDHLRLIRYVNAEARRILRLVSGTADEDPTGNPLYLISSGVFREHIIRFIDDVSSSGEQMTRVVQVHDLHERWFELHAIPVSDNMALAHGILLIIRDVTIQVDLELETRKAGLSRIEENMEKFQILNDQIRNPLQVLTGLVDIDDSPLKVRYLEQIRSIDKVIRDFDEAWIRSEKVRRFLLTHYGHGIFLRE